MNIKAISTNIGKALIINALFMFISLMISILNGFDSAFTPLLISFLVTTLTGMFPFIFVKDRPSTSLHSGFLTIVLSWLLSFIFGMLPYVLPLHRRPGSCRLPFDDPSRPKSVQAEADAS